MFHNLSKSFYYMIAIQDRIRFIDVNTSVISQNLCKNVSEIFNETILYEYSYLKRLKLYHLPCQQNKIYDVFLMNIECVFVLEDHNSVIVIFLIMNIIIVIIVKMMVYV